MKKPRREFIWTNRAWYAAMTPDIYEHDEITFGLYYPDGGTAGEMGMRWYDLGGKQVPRLEVYDDAWKALHSFQDLLTTLAEYDGQNITPEKFIYLLKFRRFKDRTEYERPKG